MHTQYLVRLTAQERAPLDALLRKGTAAADKSKQAHMLLKAEADGAAGSDEAIAAAVSVPTRTVAGMRERFVEQGLEAALTRKKQERPSQQPLFDGEAEARLIALGCSAPPAGQARWTLRLLAATAVELAIVEATSHETGSRTRKQTR